MAKSAKCGRCGIRWEIRILDQTPLRELRCPECKGPLGVLRPGKYMSYDLRPGEPEHGNPVIANVTRN